MKKSLLAVAAATLLSSSAFAQAAALGELAGLAPGELPKVPVPAAASAPKAPSAPLAEPPKAFESCESVLDGAPVKLSFYRDHAVQSMPGTKVPDITMPLTVTAEDAARTRVKLFAAFSPDTVFAEVDIPKTPTSKVEIYAIRFHAVWGVFDCTRL